jgi:hypothetical protein
MVSWVLAELGHSPFQNKPQHSPKKTVSSFPRLGPFLLGDCGANATSESRNDRHCGGICYCSFLGDLALQEVMVKRVRIGGSTAEKSEMPGFIKPQLAVPKSKVTCWPQARRLIRHGEKARKRTRPSMTKGLAYLVSHRLPFRTLKPEVSAPHVGR